MTVVINVSVRIEIDWPSGVSGSTGYHVQGNDQEDQNVGEMNVSRRQSRFAFDNFDDVVVFLNPATWKVDKMNSLADSAYQLTRTT